MDKPPPPFAEGGKRLRRYVTGRWARSDGGIVGLARRIGSTSETIHSWFRGDSEPSIAHLRDLARELGVSRWEIVAILDGAEIPTVADPDELPRRVRQLELAVDALARRAIEGEPAPALPRVRAG